MLPRVVVAERHTSVAEARNSVTLACAVNWKAERRWARSRSMCGRAVPRVNRQAEPDRTAALDEMNLGVASHVSESMRVRHQVKGPDGKVLSNLFAGSPGARRLFSVSVLASTSCVRGQSVSVSGQVGDWFDPKSFSVMMSLWLALGCVLVFVLMRAILTRRKAWGASEESSCELLGVSPVKECEVSHVEKQVLRAIKRLASAALANSRRVGRSRVRSPRLGYRRELVSSAWSSSCNKAG